MVIPPTEIWLPDIGIENSADTFYHDTFHTDFHVRLYSNGSVQWSFGGQFGTTCDLDMTYFPYDRQTCKIQIANWAYHGNEVRLRNKASEIELRSYQTHGIWEIERTEATWKNTFYASTGSSPYPEVDFILYMRRKSQFYNLNLLLPCILIIIVNLGVFWLPVDSGEKVSLAVTLLLAFSVLQIVLADQTPVNSDHNPVLGRLLVALMAISSISVISSITILYLHHKDASRRVPLGLRKFFFRGLATLVCMRSSVPEVTTDKVNPSQENVAVQDLDVEHNPEKKTAPASIVGTNQELSSIAENLTYITQVIKKKDSDDEIIDEWKCVANVLDRVLFWISTIVVIVVVIYYLLRQDPSH